MKNHILAGSFALLLAATSAFAVTDTWDGGGANDFTSTGLNWADNTAPASDLINTDLIFAGSVRLTPEIAVGLNAHSVTFNNTAGAFVFGGFGLTIGAGGIVNNDTNTQTLFFVTLGVPSTSFNAASGPLAFDASFVDIGGNSLSLDGTNAFSFPAIIGTGTVTKNGAGPMTYHAGSQQMDLVINAGTVSNFVNGFNSTDTVSSTASFAVNGTSALNVVENMTLDGATITRASGAVLSIANAKTLTAENGGDITITGAYTQSNNSTTTVTGAGSTLSVSTTFALGSAAVLNVQDGGQLTAGSTVTLNTNSALNIDGGTVNLGGTLQQNGGVVNFSAGALSFAGGLVVGSAGPLGSNLTIAASQQLTVGGTTTVDAFRTLTLDGGSLSTGTLVNNGTFDFNKGTLTITSILGLNVGTGGLGSNVTLGTGMNLAVTNTTGINSGATLRIDGGSFSSAPITNSGTIDHRAGAFSFTGTLTNNSGGRIFIADTMSTAAGISNNGTITLQNGTGQISGAITLGNNGLVTGDGTISTPVTNASAGQIRGEAGKTIYFTGAFAANAGELNLQGGTLDFTGAITNSTTGFISGRGALYTAGLTNNGVMAFSGGTADIHGDVTLNANSRVVTSGAASVTTFFDDVVHNGLEIFTGAACSTVIFGSQTGAGAFTGTGTVYNVGDLRPGNSPANVSYGGALVLGTLTTLTMELGGITPGSQYDRLSIAGSASLDGDLDVSLINGFLPSSGQSFNILTAAAGINGTFDATNLPALTGGLFFNLAYSPTTVTLSVAGILGDYNRNGIIDAPDYVLWRKTITQSGPALAADGNNNGTIDPADFTIWRINFGIPAGSGTNLAGAIPEPTTSVLLMFATTGCYLRRRRAA